MFRVVLEQLPLGQSMKGRMRPSGSASSRVASSASSAARRSPSRSLAMAWSRCASARAQRSCRAGAEPSSTGASASIAPSGLSCSKVQGRERDADSGAVTLFRASYNDLELCGLRVAHSDPYLESAPAHVDREHVLAGEQPFEALRAREFRQRFVEAALAEAQHAAGVVEHDLGSPIGCRA